MIYLRTGLPGASKSLNSLRELVLSQKEDRPFFYNNVKLLMLDMEVANSFSGWFYGWYFPNLKDAAQKRKLIKIMKPIHNEDEFVTLSDLPWLQTHFDSHNHFDTWLYWVKKVYPKEKLVKLNNVLDCIDDEQKATANMWDMVKPLNLHFTHFEDPNYWFDLPKSAVILIDECQQFFPPRQVGSRIPQAIAKLETHRHGGYDLHFITQDATLADQNLRKLVGRHIHFYNPFGGKRITRYEAPQTFDPKNYHDKKQATKKFTAHATNFYGLYWSAEIHTHGFKFPKMLFVALLTLLMVGGGLWFIVNMIQSKKTAISEPVQQVEQSQGFIPAANAAPVQSLSNDLDENDVLPNAYNPMTEPYSVNVEPTAQDSVLKDYLTNLMGDVFISGSMEIRGDTTSTFDYTFYRSTDNSVFHPLDVGLVVQAIEPCFAIVSIGDVMRPITCNPFYKRVPVDDEERSFDRFGDDNESKKDRFL